MILYAAPPHRLHRSGRFWLNFLRFEGRKSRTPLAVEDAEDAEDALLIPPAQDDHDQETSS